LVVLVVRWFSDKPVEHNDPEEAGWAILQLTPDLQQMVK
jgi:hypothetical protein